VADPTRSRDPGFGSLLCGFDARIDRKTYAAVGFGLMAFKYVAELALVRLATGKWWTPAEYFDPWFKSRLLAGGPRLPWDPGSVGWLPWVLVIWTIPFIWIGVSMSVRRAADAGLSPWLGLLFLVPWVNYAAMLVLALLPTSPKSEWSRREVIHPALRLASAITSASAGVVIGLLFILLGTRFIGDYGIYLFLGLPVVFGAITAFLHNWRVATTLGRTFGVVLFSFAALIMLIILFAMEGLGCGLMALPLAMPLAMIGAYIGWSIALCTTSNPRQAIFPALFLLPLLFVVDRPGNLPVHEVRSSIEIAAPPEVVWKSLVAFGEIPDPPTWMFRLGIACPQGARIEGSGPGAVRYCEFSTGPFVEPITDWDPPRRLAFDVASQPPPMIEWSPWDIHPAHLDGSLKSRRGEFRLIALPGGRTRLEGSTWYTVDLHPEPYWRLWSDGFIGLIHERVLRHVRRLAENE
jgi:uncharacterized membrane protein YhaH (DUF805 family)